MTSLLRRSAFLFAVIAAVSFPAFAQQRIEGAVGSERTFHWTGKLAADQTVSVKDINGNNDTEPATSDELEITATKKGRDADEAKVVLVRNSEGVTVCAVFPDYQGSDYSECGNDHHTNDHDHNYKISVDFRLRIPKDLRFYAANVNGNVRAEGLGRHAEAVSVNGNVKISTSGIAEARTVNGNVEASMGGADWSGKLEFASVN